MPLVPLREEVPITQGRLRPLTPAEETGPPARVKARGVRGEVEVGTGPDLPVEELKWSAGGGFLPGSAEELLSVLLDPANLLTLGTAGTTTGLRQGLTTGPALKRGASWLAQGVPDIIKGVRGGAQGLLRGLSASEIEKRIPPAMATPIKAPPFSQITSPSQIALSRATQMNLPFSTSVGTPMERTYPEYLRLKELIDRYKAQQDTAAQKFITHPPLDPTGRTKVPLTLPTGDIPTLVERSEKLLRQGPEWIEREMKRVPSVPTPPPVQAPLHQPYLPLGVRPEAPPTPRTPEGLLAGPPTPTRLSPMTGLIEKRVGGSPPPPIKPTNTQVRLSPLELNPSEMKILWDKDLPDLPLPPKKGVKEGVLGRIKGIGRGIGETISSPYVHLEREPTGRGIKIWESALNAEKRMNAESVQFLKEFQANVKMRKDSKESQRVGYLLDNFLNVGEIPPNLLSQLKPEELHTFEWMRGKWEQAAQTLEGKGILAPNRKIRNYFFRIFPSQDIRRAWGSELETVNTLLESAKGSRMGLLKVRKGKLEEAIDTFDSKGTILYDVLPRNIDVAFLKPREGRPGYSFDAVGAMLKYHDLYKKKIYLEPFQKEAVSLLKGIDREYFNYAKWFARRFAGLDKLGRSQGAQFLDGAERVLTSLEYLKDLGFNIRSALVNLTQHANTIVEIGPTHWAKGLKFAFSPEGQKVWNGSGHAMDVPQMYWGFLSKGFSEVQKRSGYLFDLVELGNRKAAYLSAYLKELDKGRDPTRAIVKAEEVLRRTQFLYGPLGMPKLHGAFPGGKVLMQFTTFPIKQMELMTHWAKHHPQKLLAYVALAHGGQESLKMLGVDMSAALGMGVDLGEMTKALVEASQGQGTKAKVRAKMALPKTPLTPSGRAGSGVFPSGFAPMIDTLRSVFTAISDWVDTGEMDPQKLRGALPMQPYRIYEMGKALSEGQIETPSVIKGRGITPQSGYPLRGKGGVLRETLKPWELGVRTFVARPYSETQQALFLGMEKGLEEERRGVMQDILTLRAQGKEREADELIRRYGAPSISMGRAQEEKQRFTPRQRMEKRGKYPKFKRFIEGVEGR